MINIISLPSPSTPYATINYRTLCLYVFKK